MTYYRTTEARDAAAEQVIGCYLEDGWAPEVEFVSAGEVTHCAQVLDKTMRPADEDLEDGCDGDGMDWPEGIAWRGNYELAPLPSNAQVTGRPPAEGGESDELGEHDGR
jgi:hypothetical protein